MNTRAISTLVRRDLMIVVQSKGVLLPLIIIPFLFFIGLPFLASASPSLINIPGMNLTRFEDFIARMPVGLQTELAVFSGPQKLTAMILIYFLAPLFLVVPLMVASVIAADSFAGEKERKTLEALLYTPTTDLELFLAKMLSAWLPALAVTLGGFLLYALVANLAAWPVMGRVFFPNAMWVILVLWVAPASAGLGLGAMVLVSSRVGSFQEAYQLGSVVVLPLVLLLIGQSLGVLYFSAGLAALLGLILWVVDLALLWFGVRSFQRGELIARI